MRKQKGTFKVGHLPTIKIYFAHLRRRQVQGDWFFHRTPNARTTSYLKTLARVGSEAVIRRPPGRWEKSATLSFWLSAQPFMRYFVSHCVKCEIWFPRGFSSPMPACEYIVSYLYRMHEGLRKPVNNVSGRRCDLFLMPNTTKTNGACRKKPSRVWGR